MTIHEEDQPAEHPPLDRSLRPFQRGTHSVGELFVERHQADSPSADLRHESGPGASPRAAAANRGR